MGVCVCFYIMNASTMFFFFFLLASFVQNIEIPTEYVLTVAMATCFQNVLPTAKIKLKIRI